VNKIKTFDTQGKRDIFLFGNFKETDHLGALGIYGRIVLK
jgi:hypothetical protein